MKTAIQDWAQCPTNGHMTIRKVKFRMYDNVPELNQ